MSRLAQINPQVVQTLLIMGPAALAAGVGLLTLATVAGKLAMLLTPLMMLNGVVFQLAGNLAGLVVTQLSAIKNFAVMQGVSLIGKKDTKFLDNLVKYQTKLAKLQVKATKFTTPGKTEQNLLSLGVRTQKQSAQLAALQTSRLTKLAAAQKKVSNLKAPIDKSPFWAQMLKGKNLSFNFGEGLISFVTRLEKAFLSFSRMMTGSPFKIPSIKLPEWFEGIRDSGGAKQLKFAFQDAAVPVKQLQFAFEDVADTYKQMTFGFDIQPDLPFGESNTPIVKATTQFKSLSEAMKDVAGYAQTLYNSPAFAEGFDDETRRAKAVANSLEVKNMPASLGKNLRSMLDAALSSSSFQTSKGVQTLFNFSDAPTVTKQLQFAFEDGVEGVKQTPKMVKAVQQLFDFQDARQSSLNLISKT